MTFSWLVESMMRLAEQHLTTGLSIGEIRVSLHAAVVAVHVPWGSMNDPQLQRIKRRSNRCGSVYSTNYDLILYWSVMAKAQGAGFPDLFFDQNHRFDPRNTEIWSGSPIYFLHGGIHLKRLANGGTVKRTADVGSNLLDTFASKVRRRRDAFAGVRGKPQRKGEDDLAIGLSLPLPAGLLGRQETARHLGACVGGSRSPMFIAAIGADRRVYYGVHAPTPAAQRAEMLRVQARLTAITNLEFFDSSTFPLGDPMLAVSAP